MKKVLALILLLCVCVGLFACSNEKTSQATAPTEPIETIDERPLLIDSDNGAKAQMNVGKGTTVHGVVTNIGTSYCTIRLIVPKNASVYVEMPMEQLAKLNNNTFVSIEGVVSAFNANGNGKYTIRGEKILGIEEMDTWVKDHITKNYNVYCLFDSSNYAYYAVFHEYDIELLYAYAKLGGDLYRINNNTKLKEYLTGEWHNSLDASPLTSCEFGESGHFSLGGAKMGRIGGEWSVEDGRLYVETSHSYLQDFSGPVYVLSNDIFIYEGILFARKK